MITVFNFGIGRLVAYWGFRNICFFSDYVEEGMNNIIMILQARETPLHSITAHQSAVKAVSWCPWQSNVLATAGQFQESVISVPHEVFCLLAGGTVDRTVRIWNTASMTQLQSFDTGSQVQYLRCEDGRGKT